jgi:hypothetical protein
MKRVFRPASVSCAFKLIWSAADEQDDEGGCAMCTWLAIGFVIHHKFHKPSLQRIDLKSSLTDHTVIFAAFLYCLRTSADLRFLTRALRAAIGAFGHASETAALIV